MCIATTNYCASSLKSGNQERQGKHNQSLIMNAEVKCIRHSTGNNTANVFSRIRKAEVAGSDSIQLPCFDISYRHFWSSQNQKHHWMEYVVFEVV